METKFLKILSNTQDKFVKFASLEKQLQFVIILYEVRIFEDL